ncbi:MAG: transcriptional regulator NrdR [Sphaerochaetaceae bacterium]|nr:transcriptional regulator NrdR [Sphaerochaetaceae bacterium]
MKCPACGADNDKVLETRTTNNGSAMRRRRECLDCGYRFTSYERVEDKPITVIKKNGNIQAFDPDKIQRSLRICTDKRNISQETLDELISNVEEQIKLIAGPKHEITSSQIGEEILRQLSTIDAVAYVRFASVYRSFNNVEQFIAEIEKFQK